MPRNPRLRWRYLLDRVGITPSGFDCDTCKYNWREACRDPKRPNKKVCKEWARR